MFFSLLVTTCAVQGLRLQRWNKQNVGLFRQRYFDQQGRHQMRKLHKIQNRPTIETSRTITEVKEMQNGNTSVIAVKKQPAPSNDTLPQCYKPQCTRRKIKVKVYIKDDLWDKASQASPGTFFVNTVKTFFSALNKYLARLDNGGFEVVFNNTVAKLSNSDITFGPTYNGIGHPVVGGAYTPSVCLTRFSFRFFYSLPRPIVPAMHIVLRPQLISQ